MANPEHLKKLEEGVEAWNAWREENPDVVPDLSGAKLSGINLNRANLSKVNLSEADLSGAKLFWAYLYKANLSKADFRDANLRQAFLRGANLSEMNLVLADLSGADLSGANLRGASLSGAELSRTNLIRTDLSGANMSDSDIQESIFIDIDLSAVNGLDTVTHFGPSSIGIDTIYASKGKIPEVFLRGVGVPENFIQYIPSLTCNPLEFYSCFISYSHSDKDFARRLYDRLQGHGIRCWVDEHKLTPGDDLHDQIDHGIKLWDKVVLCCSEASLTSWWVDKELDRALQKEERLWKERQEKVLAIIPVDLDGYVFSWDGGKAGMIQSRFIGDFKNWTDNYEFEKSFKMLLKALRSPESREPAPTPKL